MSNENDGTSLIDQLNHIPESSDNVRSQTQEIENEINQIIDTYQTVQARVDDGLEDQYTWNPLADAPVEDTSIDITQSLDKLETDLFDSDGSESIEIEAETRQDYLRSLVDRTEEKEAVKQEFEGRIDQVKDLSRQAFDEFLESTQSLSRYDSPSDALEGSWGEKLDQKLQMTEGKKETQRIMEDIANRADAERTALEDELERTVNEYVEDAYDQATTISERLGGKGRAYTGELDLLDQISRTRAAVIANQLEEGEYTHSNDEVARQEGALREGKKAMEAQAEFIAEYAKNLDQAREEAEYAIEHAAEVLDEEQLSTARERLSTLQQAYEEFGNAFEDDCYDSLAEAIEGAMQQGMKPDEELETSHRFSFTDMPYLGSRETGESTER